MNRPLISTITPCYRMARYLPLFLDWLPRQTFFEHLEVVLDHNEPTSDEVSLVRAFQTRYPGRIRHLIRPKVDPIGISMNRCIREAQADLVAIWNVDDLRTPDSIEAQANILLKDSKTAIVYGNFWEVRAFGATHGRLIRHETIPTSELTRSMILGPYYMFRKDLCRKAGFFDEQLRSGADFDLAIRLALHGNAHIAPVPLGYYLNEGLGASTRAGSLQPVECAVIELRYGIYDKINYSFVAQAARYNITHLSFEDRWLPVRDFVPFYNSFMDERLKTWHQRGIEHYVRRTRWKRSILWKGVRAVKHTASSLKPVRS